VGAADPARMHPLWVGVPVAWGNPVIVLPNERPPDQPLRDVVGDVAAGR
jgi:hypothetical protein